MSTRLGHDEHPGEIDGDPAAANLVRILAHDPRAWWRTVLVDRDGHLEALGARRYRAAALLELTVKLHDRTCQFPAAHRRAGATRNPPTSTSTRSTGRPTVPTSRRN